MHFHPLSIFALMLLGHFVADYTLQGWLADAKRKAWWEKCFDWDVPDKYGRDYICALFCHALYWSLIVCLPLAALDAPAYFAMSLVQGVIHAIIDDLKANKSALNLCQDQALHLVQVASVFGYWMWAR